MADPDPFIGIAAFTTELGRSLTDAETITATRLLQVVSDWIRGHAPDDVSTTAAEQVVFEVVRDALTYGGYERLSHFENKTRDRTESGTFDYAASVLDDYLTNKHKQLLGIRPRPAYYFGD